MKSQLVPLVLVVLACGCHPAELNAEDLTRQGGCGDVFLYTTEEKNTVGVSFYSAGLLAQAKDSPRTFTFQLPDSRVQLKRLEGTRISSNLCSDVHEGKIYREHEALSGTATLTLRSAQGDPNLPRADLQLRDVVFNVDGQLQTLPSLELNDIMVGWYAG